MMASLLTVAGVATVALAAWVTGGGGGTTQATGPTPPADCFVADEPTAGGPAAPSDLVADLPPIEFLGQTDVSWTDNSDDETCFVIEGTLPNYLDFEVIAVLPPNTTAYRDEGPYVQGRSVRYRVYAATASERSQYSNEDNVTIPILSPTPTGPLPTPKPPTAPTPTPEETASPSPPPSPTASPTSSVPSPTASPTPAQLPEAGGSAEGSSTPVATLIIVGAALLILSAAVVFSRRPTEER